jgi:predicted SAM-dependent methyltransferase
MKKVHHLRLLNFGCGGTFHSDWTNIDTVPVSPDVIRHDLMQPFPFADATFDAVYGSHVFEHLEPAAAQVLLMDCGRVLKPGGVIRLVVPDLEAIAGLYLRSLEAALAGDRDAEMRYDWFMLELYDQVVRKRSGGNMAKFLADSSADGSLRCIADRIGGEGAQAPTGGTRRFSSGARFRRKLRAAVHSARRKGAAAFAFLFLGARGSSALREGLFRNAGEVHQWMYDRFSLGRALERTGFRSIRVCRAGESEIADFARYQLEFSAGRERKPDSLYMEGRK